MKSQERELQDEDYDLFEFIRSFTMADIKRMLAGEVEVARAVVPIACECGGPAPTLTPCPSCGMEPAFGIENPARPEDFSDQELVRLGELLDPDPPRSPEKCSALAQEVRALVLADRHAAKCYLWRPDDEIHADMEDALHERLERFVYTLSHWKKRGCPDDLLDRSSPEVNGDAAMGRMRVRDVA